MLKWHRANILCACELLDEYPSQALDFIVKENRRLGGAQPGNRFLSFVLAYARSGFLVELDRKRPCRSFPFSCFLAELPLFPFGGDELFLFPSPHPQTTYPILVGLIGDTIIKIAKCNAHWQVRGSRFSEWWLLVWASCRAVGSGRPGT